MEVPHPQGFPPEFRMTYASEFRRARLGGRKTHTPHFLIYSLKKVDGPSRLGLTVSRKVGGAVVRNRVKRLLREIFRRWNDRLPFELDISIIAKPGSGTLLLSQIQEELSIIFRLNSWEMPHD